ncbi:ATP-dependent RNA helicase DEAH12, chloroplastic [Elysia marginata]|uniref:ATP-dependent RNA helicase DEAH12, chloroplastic n=1 Tax=Elysia marginata TaxID=1093978 RepID=A0AAV4ET54_9GAST|nr:ATP-dependent RNA helicase DEAH12, chloroplastic [Elysia marginata]
MRGRFRGNQRGNSVARGGYSGPVYDGDTNNSSNAIRINLVIPSPQSQVHPIVNVPTQQAAGRVPLHNSSQLESGQNFSRNSRAKYSEDRFHGFGSHAVHSVYRDQRPGPTIGDQRYRHGGERDHFQKNERPDYYQGVPPHFDRWQPRNMANDMFEHSHGSATRQYPSQEFNTRSSYRYDAPPYFNDSQAQNVTYRQNEFWEDRAGISYGIERGSPRPGYNYEYGFNSDQDGRYPPTTERPPPYESLDFRGLQSREGRGQGGQRGRGGSRGRGGGRCEMDYGGGRGRGRGESEMDHGGGRGISVEKTDEKLKQGKRGDYRGRGGKSNRGREGKGGLNQASKSRERSSSTESYCSVSGSCTGISAGHVSSSSGDNQSNKYRWGIGYAEGKEKEQGKGCGDSRGGSGVGRGKRNQERGKQEDENADEKLKQGKAFTKREFCRGRGGKASRGRDRKSGLNQFTESLERSLSTESSSCIGINVDKVDISSSNKELKMPLNKKESVLLKKGVDSGSRRKDEPIHTKTSITIKKQFENTDELKQVFGKHFKTKKSAAEMKFLEEATIFTKTDTICVIIITSGSKQQAKRLIKMMCQGIHHDLLVPCFFCVSGWNIETPKDSKAHGRAENKQQTNNNLADVLSTSIKPSCKEETEEVKEFKSGKPTKKESKTPKQTVSKVAITISKGFESKQQLVAYLKEAVGEMASKVREEPDSICFLSAVTLCEYVFSDEASARGLSEVLNKVTGIKATCVSQKTRGKQQKEVIKEIKDTIQEAMTQINERFKMELENHASKVFQKYNSLLELQSKLTSDVSDNEANSAQEVLTLMDKLRELESQKKEFEIRIENLKTLLGNATSHKDVENILRDCGIECKRLSAGLPMYARRSDLIEKVKSNQVSIILGETGSGKSTQLAQYLYEEGLAGKGQIVCTQPRKVAALTLAERVSKELVRNVGSLVGYKSGVRQKFNQDTKILFYTDHTLLNECLQDHILSKYSCIIIDEAHERSIYTDILLGMIKAFLPHRPDLKLVITSATINPEVFIQYFTTTPELRVSGRTFPVDIVYEDSDNSKPFENYEKKAIEKVIQIHESQQKGDILVFLTSAVEIMRCCEELTNRLQGRTDFVCFPLHGQLPPEEQRKVFQPVDEGKRKIIFSTNCAETSITIDGIKFVVDTGVVNEMRYDPRKNMSSLGTQIISQSSAEQRKGRAGRTSCGTCYRLYTEANYDSMVTTNQPEILRVHLGLAVLKLAELGVDVRKYDFVESPDQEAIDSAICVLQELTALSLEDACITEVGRWLSKLPFDPRQSYLVYLGHKKELLYDAITLASLISNGSNMIYRGLNEAEEQVAARTKNRFSSLFGDLFMWFEIYKTWVELPKNEQTSWCRKNCVNYKVLSLTKQTISDTRQMLTRELGIRFEFNYSDNEDTLNTLRHMVFEANLPSLCHYSGHKRAGYFTASTGHQVHPHPSSNLAIQNHYPEWVIYLELTKTSRDFIRGITMVEEIWIQSAIDSGKLPVDFFEVKDHKVEAVFRKEVGQTVFHKMVGPQFSKLRPLEDSLAEAGMSSVVVEADKDLGTFEVHSSSAMHPGEAKKLNSIIDQTICDLRIENEELSVTQDKSGVRALLGEGASVAAIFMPDQSNKVLISRADSAMTEESLRSKFSSFGKIVECIKFRKGHSWGFLKYSTFHEANNAVNATSNHPELQGSLMVNAAKPKRSNFEARLSWCRRAIKGNGIAIIRCPTLERCALVGRVININGTFTEIKVSRKSEDELVVFNTGRAEEPEIKASILHLVDWDDKKKQQLQVNVIREQVDLNSKHLERFEQELTENFEKLGSAGKFSIRFLTPKKGSQNYVAFISFENAINGFQACRLLRREGLFLNGQKVNISPDLKTTINIPKVIMKVCEKKFNQLKEAVENDDIGITLKFRQLPRGDFSADILTSDEESMVFLRAAIHRELEGDVINCSQNNVLKGLLKKQGIDFLRKVQTEIEGVLIMSNVRAENIRIFGSEGSVTKAKTEINKYLSKLVEGKHEEIFLREQGRPAGLLKALLRQFPELREDFVNRFEVQDVFIDYKRHTLSVVGSKESIGKLKQTINNIQKNMPPTKKVNDAERLMPDCVTCMCPIDDSTELYRLEGCGHSFCVICLRMQLAVQVDDKQFPLACAKEGCGKPWLWKDIKMCLRKGWISEAKLVERAVDAFVAASGERYKFCPSPNCPVPYEVTDIDEGCEFNCPSCQISLCSSCHTAYHPGLTCRQAASHAKVDLSFQEWKKQNASRCKPCPGCAVPVEKSEGCNKMHCIKCKVYFCWLCLEKFNDEQKCYAHLVKIHGGFS